MRLAALLLLASIPAFPADGEDLTLKIPPVQTTIHAGGSEIPLTAWGTVSNSPAGAFELALTADLGGLQDHITPLLAAELNRQDRCGERLAIDRAELAPSAPAAVLTVHLRYERWGCARVFGKEAVRRLVGGNALIVVRLTPSAGPEGIGVTAETTKVDADGSLGEVLASGSPGASVKEKIAAGIQSAVRKSLDLKAALPERAREAAAFESARFSSGLQGRLWIVVAARLRFSPGDWEAFARRMNPGK